MKTALEDIIRKGKGFINSRKGFIVTSSALVAGALLDSVSTHYLLGSVMGGDLSAKLNPLIKSLMENYGFFALYSTKMAYSSIVIGIATAMPPARYASLFGGALFTAAAINNFYQIAKNM